MRIPSSGDCYRLPEAKSMPGRRHQRLSRRRYLNQFPIVSDSVSVSLVALLVMGMRKTAPVPTQLTRMLCELNPKTRVTDICLVGGIKSVRLRTGNESPRLLRGESRIASSSRQAAGNFKIKMARESG